MARARSPKRDEAMKIYLDTDGQVKIKDIADQIGIPDSRVRKWKTEDKWDEKIKERSDSNKGALLLSNRSAPIEKKTPAPKKKRGGQPGNGNARGHGAPIGNDNAKDNKGGAPPRNGNAIKTGEYQTIWTDYLTEEERAFYDGIDTDKDAQTNITLRNLTYRENLMLKRIFELQDGVDNIETSIVKERCNQMVPVQVCDEATGEIQTKSTTVSKMRVKEITEKKKSVLGEILRIEEALTRVQEKKAKLLSLKHKIELDHERMELEKIKIGIAKNDQVSVQEDPLDAYSKEELMMMIDGD